MTRLLYLGYLVLPLSHPTPSKPDFITSHDYCPPHPQFKKLVNPHDEKILFNFFLKNVLLGRLGGAVG